MENKNLFIFYDDEKSKQFVSTVDLLNALKAVGADQCKTLFIHTDVAAFGTPNPELKRRDFLGAIYETILALNVETIVFPAFTFSFANGESFDVNNSTAKYMGALNEFVRKQEGTVRSLDPLMSVVAVGKNAPEYYAIGNRCMGTNGIFYKLRNTPNVKFLFLGAKPTECFTYAHYVEAEYGVPYRFEKWFTGKITDREGNSYEAKCSVHAGCRGITPAPMIPFEREMLLTGQYHTKKIGNANIICFDESVAYDAVWRALEKDICAFLTQPFKPEDLAHTLKEHTERIVMVP